MTALQDDDWPTREFAAASLAKIQDRRAREALETALPEAQEETQCIAVEALIEAGDTSAIEILTRKICQLRQPLRESLAWTLRHHVKWTPVLVAALHDSSSEVRNTAAQSLKALAWKPPDEKDPARWIVAMRLWDDAVKLGSAAIGALAVVAEEPDEKLEYRRAAVGALVRMGSRQCIPALLRIAGDLKCPTVLRSLAIDHLGWVATPECVRVLEELAKEERVGSRADYALKQARGRVTRLEAVLIVFNRKFPTSGSFADEILTKMRAMGRLYMEWTHDGVPLILSMHPKAQDPTTYTAMALIEFRRRGISAEAHHPTQAAFEGSEGISGVIVGHWNNPMG